MTIRYFAVIIKKRQKSGRDACKAPRRERESQAESSLADKMRYSPASRSAEQNFKRRRLSCVKGK